MEPRQFRFDITIDPRGQERFRFTKKGARYKTEEAKAYEAALKILIKKYFNEDPFTGPILVEVDFYLKAPMRPRYFKPAVKPDLDNLQKGLFDAMNGIVYKDDCQIVSVTAKKHYCYLGRNPSIVCFISRA